MPHFEFEIRTNFQGTRNEHNKLVWKMALDDEWTILCHSYDYAIISRDDVIESFEIQRRNTDGEHTVSGNFQIMTENRSILWKHNYSTTITTGYQGIELGQVTGNFPADYTYLFQGVVKISDKYDKALESGKSKTVNHLECLEELSNHLERLLVPDATCFADVTLKCGGASIPAHKNILSTRSPVFEAMFSSQMEESRKNEVNIPDIDVSVLRALLTYVYTGKTNDLSASSAKDLLFAADKYQIDGLKRLCSNVLKDTASLQNVLSVLVLGEMHDEELKTFAVDFICKNCIEFSVLEKSEEWKTLRKERPELAMDVMSSLVIYRENHEKLI